MLPETRILFLMSGSIACAKATGLISAWVKDGHEVRVAGTASVPHFVGRATLEGLTGEPYHDDTFSPGRAMDHISLAQWADLVVACPASSGLIGRFANGIADDLVTTLWQAAWGRKAPQFLVPAMNTHMWNYPATQENLRRLKQWGIHVLPTASGDLACGETGAGRMLDPEEIRFRIEDLVGFERRQRGRRRILITGGGTREPIDAVRFIGNSSTGRTSATLADQLAAQGNEVTWLGAQGALEPGSSVIKERYVTFGDLAAQLERLLGENSFDVVVHAAAVSDFSVDRTEDSTPATDRKMASGANLNLALKPNPKLLRQLKVWSSNTATQVVGFKLTVGADAPSITSAVGRLFEGGASDLVVHNDTSAMSDGQHRFDVVTPEGESKSVNGARALAAALSDWFQTTEDVAA